MSVSVKWKDVVGYEGLYHVSNTGLVRSLDRLDSCGRRIKGKQLKAAIGSHGYFSVALLSEGSQKSWTVHSLVAAAFIGPCPPRMCVRHADDNKLNCLLSNLSYGSRSDNSKDAQRNGITNKVYSQFIGVVKAAKCPSRPYRALIRAGDRSRVHIGNFKTELEAARAYDKYIIDNNIKDRALNNV